MSRPWMPLYVADYLRDTRKLTAAEHGAYLLLIMEYWTGGGLPDDDKQLARIASMSPAEWRKAKPNVQAFFAPGWKHKRIDAELAKSAEISSKRAASAKQKHSKSSAIAEQVHTQSQSQLQKEDSIADARVSGSAFTEGSKTLATAFLQALGFATPLDVPPEFAGVDWRAVGWEQAGWSADMIAVEAKRIGPGKPLSYHEKVFATAHAKLQAPLPKVEIREAETLQVTHARQHGNIVQAADRLVETIRSFDAGPGDRPAIRSGEGAAPVRLLSKG